MEVASSQSRALPSRGEMGWESLRMKVVRRQAGGMEIALGESRTTISIIH